MVVETDLVGVAISGTGLPSISLSGASRALVHFASFGPRLPWLPLLSYETANFALSDSDGIRDTEAQRSKAQRLTAELKVETVFPSILPENSCQKRLAPALLEGIFKEVRPIDGVAEMVTAQVVELFAA